MTTVVATPPRAGRPTVAPGPLRWLLCTPSGALSVGVLAALVALAVVAPWWWGGRATETDFAAILQAPSGRHLLGTDGAGRDILTRTLVGARLSLVLAATATVVAAGVGVVVGAGLVLLGGRVQRIGSAVVDTWLGFPSILLSVMVVAVLSPGGGAAALAVGLSMAPFFARLTATATAAVVERDHVVAARLMGLSRRRLLGRHVLGSIGDTLAVAVFSMFSQCLIAISALSFLGLGVQAEVGAAELGSIDWGRMLNDGIGDFRQRPAGTLAPALAIALSGMAFAWFGDVVGRALNPSLRHRDRRAGHGTVEAAP